jgi:hypothetical protein
MLLRNALEKKKADEQEFMRRVEQHERSWGTEYYKGRPTLTQIMYAKVVAFWHPTSQAMHPTATIHRNLNEINEYVTHLVWHTARERLPLLRLESVFVNKRHMKIKAVRVVFEEPE